MEGRLVLQETCRECVRTPIERLVERGDPWHHVRLGCESCVRLRAVCGLRASSVLSHVRVAPRTVRVPQPTRAHLQNGDPMV